MSPLIEQTESGERERFTSGISRALKLHYRSVIVVPLWSKLSHDAQCL